MDDLKWSRHTFAPREPDNEPWTDNKDYREPDSEPWTDNKDYREPDSEPWTYNNDDLKYPHQVVSPDAKTDDDATDWREPKTTDYGDIVHYEYPNGDDGSLFKNALQTDETHHDENDQTASSSEPDSEPWTANNNYREPDSEPWTDNNDYRDPDSEPWTDNNDDLRYPHQEVSPDAKTDDDATDWREPKTTDYGDIVHYEYPNGDDGYLFKNALQEDETHHDENNQTASSSNDWPAYQDNWPAYQDYQNSYGEGKDSSDEDSSDANDSSDLYDYAPEYYNENDNSSTGVDESSENNPPQYDNYGGDYFSKYPEESEDTNYDDNETRRVDPDLDNRNDTSDEQYEYYNLNYGTDETTEDGWPAYENDYNHEENQHNEKSGEDAYHYEDNTESKENDNDNSAYLDYLANYDNELDSSTTTEMPDHTYDAKDYSDYKASVEDYYGLLDAANYDDSYETANSTEYQTNNTQGQNYYMYRDTDAMHDNDDYSDYNIQPEKIDEPTENSESTNSESTDGFDNDLSTPAPDYPNPDYYGEYQDSDVQRNQYPGYYDEPQDSQPDNNDEASTSNPPLYPSSFYDSDSYQMYPGPDYDGDSESENDTMEYYQDDDPTYVNYNETEAQQNASYYDHDAADDGTVGELYVDDYDISNDTDKSDVDTLGDWNSLYTGDFNDYTTDEKDGQNDDNADWLNEAGLDDQPMNQNSEEEELNYLNNEGMETESTDETTPFMFETQTTPKPTFDTSKSETANPSRR